ncbi:MAG: M48 family metalloprotease [Steroidobacteraceae bacterium]
MHRPIAAWTGCLLMLGASWVSAAGDITAQSQPQGSAQPTAQAAQAPAAPSQASTAAAGTAAPSPASTPSQAPATSSPASARPGAPAAGSHPYYYYYPVPRQPAGKTGQAGQAAAPAAGPPVPGTLGAVTTDTNVAAPVSSDTGLMGSLPDLGRPANAAVTPSDDYQIGQMELIEIRNANLLLEDPETDDYLQQLGMRLASQAHDDGQAFHYRAMRSNEINSFATFGGNVYIFTGLMLYTQNESQLASVMAHETGHVVQHHMAREVLAQSHMSLASTAEMLAAIAIGAASGGRGNTGEGMEGALAIAQATAMQRSINFTRGEEIEADYVGIQLLAAAGFDPYEMADMFESLAVGQGPDAEEFPLLQDHPVTSERIAAARERAAQFPRLKSYPQSLSYAFIKERVRVLSAAPGDRVAQYYVQLRSRRPLTAAERYGQALVQIQSGNLGEARQAVATLRELQGRFPELILLYTALGQALQASGDSNAALAQFALSEQLFPRNAPLTIHYAETLMKIGRPAQAHALLLDLFNNVDPTPPQIQLTAMAASAAGDNGDAYYYMGEYNLANGQLGLANQELELALAVPNLSNVQRQRFLARLQQVRGWMRDQQNHGG